MVCRAEKAEYERDRYKEALKRIVKGVKHLCEDREDGMDYWCEAIEIAQTTLVPELGGEK
jgi:hypothetical protein